MLFSSEAMRDQLDMDPSEMASDQDFAEWVAGNKVIKGSIPISHRYGGYQFGHWARQLGDGRAIMLGEYVNDKGMYLTRILLFIVSTPKGILVS